MKQMHPTALAPAPSGNANETAWFRQTGKNIRERGVQVGPGLRASYTTEGTLIELGRIPEQPTASTAGATKRVQIQTIASNYLITRPYIEDGTTIDANADSIIVAIPYFLRASTYAPANGFFVLGGFAYKTVVGQIRCSAGSGSDTSYVVKSFFPTYGSGQDIYAMQCDGKTDVTVATGIVPGSTTPTRLEWIDANVEGRRLDTTQTVLDICRVENSVVVQRHVAVECGPIY